LLFGVVIVAAPTVAWKVTGGDKKIDKASATFMQYVAGGKHFNQVTIVS
jgi:hypothetical protein